MTLETLKGFVLERVLADDQRTKFVAVLGRFEGNAGQAVALLSRQPFCKDTLPQLLTDATQLSVQFENDIYSKYMAQIPVELGQITLDLIYPATQKHISKYDTQKYYMVGETPELYEKVTLPFIQSIPASRLRWVYNILDKTAEAERMFFEDADPLDGFMMHPDLKWDQKDRDNLYCIALCHRRDIRCLRDLSAEHLPLLRNIRAKGRLAIRGQFGVPADQLRIYVHYQPSYYHFHVHFAHTSWEGAMGLAAGKAHLLDDIIDNIATIAPDYYSRRTLYQVLGGNDPLLSAFQELGLAPS